VTITWSPVTIRCPLIKYVTFAYTHPLWVISACPPIVITAPTHHHKYITVHKGRLIQIHIRVCVTQTDDTDWAVTTPQGNALVGLPSWWDSSTHNQYWSWAWKRKSASQPVIVYAMSPTGLSTTAATYTFHNQQPLNHSWLMQEGVGVGDTRRTQDKSHDNSMYTYKEPTILSPWWFLKCHHLTK